MSTEQTLTPAQELRAAASKIRESAEPIVTKDGTDIGEHVATWLDAVAKMWDQLIGDADSWMFLEQRNRDSLRSGPWDAQHALSLARAVNGEVAR